MTHGLRRPRTNPDTPSAPPTTTCCGTRRSTTHALEPSPPPTRRREESHPVKGLAEKNKLCSRPPNDTGSRRRAAAWNLRQATNRNAGLAADLRARSAVGCSAWLADSSLRKSKIKVVFEQLSIQKGISSSSPVTDSVSTGLATGVTSLGSSSRTLSRASLAFLFSSSSGISNIMGRSL